MYTITFDKYKDTILQLKIYSDIYQVKCKDCEFFRPNIHTDLEKYRKHLFNIYSNYERSELDSCAAYERV